MQPHVPTANAAVDPFTQHVIGHIDPQVLRTLNLVQLEAIRQAVSASAPRLRHPVDVRFSLNLLVARYYVVLLGGRDRRSEVRNREMARLRKIRGNSLLLAIYLIATASLPIVLLILYALKSLAGIDLVPDQHLWDWWG